MKRPDVPGWLRTRLLFALIITAALAFGIRFNELIKDTQPQNSDELAFRELNTIEPATGASDEKDGGHTSTTIPAPAEAAPQGEPAGESEEWKDASDNDIAFSPVQMELFEDLAKRRKELDLREKELVTREALLQAAEKNLDQKYKELSDLRAEVQEILQQQNEAEQARIASLVKIYEGMKAKDAARIFDSLDMDVLLRVLGKMSERKSAPIIASMNPERARSVTIMLSEQKALPTLDDNLSLQ